MTIDKMHHPNTKQMLDADLKNDSARIKDNDDNEDVSFDSLSTDEIALIFGYLAAESIMCARLNKKMRDAAIKTIVPIINDDKFLGGFSGFNVDSERKYNALAAMATALPNLQQICINRDVGYNNGEEPNLSDRTANGERKNIEVLSSFRALHQLRIANASLNGRYPILFNFPLLQELDISGTFYLKWDLERLVGLPSLTKLYSFRNHGLTGNINSLRVLRDTLAHICLIRCPGVRGNLMDLADFPHLTNLDLTRTSVIGDIREIRESDFRTLEFLTCDRVYGGSLYEFDRISDAPRIAADVFELQKYHPNLQLEDWCAKLSSDSPDWYDGDDPGENEPLLRPPFTIVVVKAGPRRGWRWECKYYDISESCEVNWLDPEPEIGSNSYERYIYIEELEMIEENLNVFSGYHQPPTEDEYNHDIFPILVREWEETYKNWVNAEGRRRN